MTRPNSTHATHIISRSTTPRRVGAKRGEARLTSAYHKQQQRTHEEVVEIMLRLAREDREKQAKEEETE
ncbi:hypothetical protein BW14_10610 [Bifidobacterium sp. UTBIF-68]|uniref:hypothetical protein n=1 Tax=Bifidobacterium sp. UTBIF-68 TaxID=1465262 RepID=UPI001126887C|nr:hypothetical protein [Bifidobacterium sp. UTBIF-68]TPF91959.1 hypothetical protein BW14_10610 [Bifidobacterium sp. UTBIF-68]